MSLEEHYRKEMVRMLVQKFIFCPYMNVVLDVDTCVVVLDADGDPCTIMSPQAYKGLVAIAEEKGVEPLSPPYYFDRSTLPS